MELISLVSGKLNLEVFKYLEMVMHIVRHTMYSLEVVIAWFNPPSAKKKWFEMR